MKLYMASGIVRVSSGMLETKVIVAPNSPKLRAKAKITPLKIPGAIRGKVIVKNTLKGLAPKVLAACSNLLSTASILSLIALTISGKATIALASAAPCQLKLISTDKYSISQAPIMPCCEKPINSR